MPTNTATASWSRGLKDGSGEHSAGSGAFRGTYSLPTRLEGADGRNGG